MFLLIINYVLITFEGEGDDFSSLKFQVWILKFKIPIQNEYQKTH